MPRALAVCQIKSYPLHIRQTAAHLGLTAVISCLSLSSS
jgi:hypothetical protein